jgi:hypothetical protein
MHEMLTVGVLNDSEAEKGQKAAAVASLAMAVGQRLPEGLPPGHMACHAMVMEEVSATRHSVSACGWRP